MLFIVVKWDMPLAEYMPIDHVQNVIDKEM
jgi:hypothetical protein